MLVLHAALDPHGVLVWGTTHDEPADGAAVRAGLGVLGDDGFDSDTAADGLADVVARVTVPDEVAGMTTVEVSALRLAPGATVRVLAGGARGGVGDGVRTDAAWGVVAEAVRHGAGAALRQEFVPSLVRSGDVDATGDARFEARWRTIPRAAARDAIDAIAARLPASARCVEAADGGVPAGSHSAVSLTRALVDDVVDELVRTRLVAAPVTPALASADAADTVHDRWLRALVDTDALVEGPVDVLDRLSEELARWQQRLRRSSESPFRLCLRLEEPDDPTAEMDRPGGAVWFLRFLLQAREDPSLLVDVADAWRPTGETGAALRRLAFHQGEHLLAPLGEAARWFDPIAERLAAHEPDGCELTTEQAHAFLAEAVPLLEQTGVGVFVPAWWQSRGGRWRLGVRAQVRTQLVGGRRNLDALNLETLVAYDWAVAVGDSPLTHAELTELAAQKGSLVRIRGRWVEIDPAELRAAIAHLERYEADPLAGSRAGASGSVAELLVLAGGSAARTVDGLPVTGVDAPDGSSVAELLAGLAAHAVPERIEGPPAGLRAQLRPYQEDGYAWLVHLTQLGLGACLADDMGLGKTVQTLALVQRAWEQDGPGPTLVVCPTTVLTNWARECAMFTPDLPVHVHHGAGRLRDTELVGAAADAGVVITSYALLARDIETLAGIDWRLVVLDEAQQIKNPGTRHAQAARALRTAGRIALTGTPVENHVGDLWSIMEFLNPGLLGRQADFRRRYMLPIQSGALPEVTAQLRRLVGPFVLRREKTDRDVIADLPDKHEAVAWCTLTTEQVALYEAVVRDAERILRGPKQAGIERRGAILATISKLKQVCNHPAQLLGDNSVVDGRSGKVVRLEGLLETVLEAGERALVFTQFVQMGELLRKHLADVFGREVLFLHGGTPRKRRDAIVERFQSGADEAPPILVLSLKAGGSGLNLTAANHVIHFDRWWNPATEQQASDRAFRIGQTRDVQVHALVCAGTVEERIDRMLLQKRGVADAVVGADGADERWITELDDDELLDLLALRSDTLLQAARLDDVDPKEWKRGL